MKTNKDGSITLRIWKTSRVRVPRSKYIVETYEEGESVYTPSSIWVNDIIPIRYKPNSLYQSDKSIPIYQRLKEKLGGKKK